MRIAAILREARQYLSAAEIHARLERESAEVSLSTVYRTLEFLRAQGAVSQRTDEAGETTYLSCDGDHHHHAICRGCGRVEDVDCEAIDQFTEDLDQHNGFLLESHSMEFFGRCRACR